MTAPTYRPLDTQSNAEVFARQAKMKKSLEYWSARCNRLLPRLMRTQSAYDVQVLTDKLNAAAAQRDRAHDALMTALNEVAY